ncbi:MAG: hypothetical protein SGJ19_09520 [Planctomycetia bacterium]|nr:hypothetical protein [Planctomycetia bacterium]
MTEQQATDIRNDYLSWSGGWPPDSEESIFVYVETSVPVGHDDREVIALLRQWMLAAGNAYAQPM